MGDVPFPSRVRPQALPTDLAQAVENIRPFLESVHDGLLLLDKNGRVVEANALVLKMFRLQREEVLGSSFSTDLSGPESSMGEFLETWMDVLKGNDRLFAWRARRPVEQSVFDAEVNFHRIGLAQKEMVLATIQDITQRKQTERESLQAQRMNMLRSVLGGIAHEFDAIVNNVLGYTYMLRKYATDTTRSTKYRTLIELSAKRGTELSDRLFALAAADSLSLRRIQVTNLLIDAIAKIEIKCPSHIAICKDIPDALPAILGDEETLGRALTQLFENALEAVSGMNSGIIEIHTRVVHAGDPALPGHVRCSPTTVAIDISDNGPGIPEELRDSVCEPFLSTQRTGRGDRLGLAEAQSTAWNHHGDLTLSESIAGRSTFTLWLPSVGTGPAPWGEEYPDGSTLRKKETVLLVDHEDGMRKIGQNFLEHRGYRVLTAADGQEAIDTFREQSSQINLVVLDLVTPHVDGDQAFLELKSIRKDIPVLFCLGHAADQIVTSLLNEQGLRTVQKPFEEESFLSAVREILDESWSVRRTS